jgi:multidrug efflux pump subunit AcrA (membrane-fusion protein)
VCFEPIRARGGIFVFLRNKRNMRMPDETNGNAANAGTGDSAAANAKADTGKVWTEKEFQDALTREADRRVSQAQAKWAEDMKATLGTTDLSGVKSQLETLASQAKQTEARANFAEAAITQGIADVKAAWAVAKEYGLINEKGRTDFEELKKNHPSLFAQPRTGTPAGRPASAGEPGKTNVTALLRDAVRGGYI